MLEKISIQYINKLFTDSVKYNTLQEKIDINIKNRICHHKVIILNIIAEYFDINTYLEIGVHNGASMSYVVHQSKSPLNCYGIDLFDDTYGHYKKDILSLNQSLNNIQKNNISKSNIYIIKGNSRKKDTIQKRRNLLKTKTIDLLFIDGDHSYEGVRSDFNNYSTFLSQNAIVVFDDYNKKWPGVVKFCDEKFVGFEKIGVFKNNEYIIQKVP